MEMKKTQQNFLNVPAKWVRVQATPKIFNMKGIVFMQRDDVGPSYGKY